MAFRLQRLTELERTTSYKSFQLILHRVWLRYTLHMKPIQIFLAVLIVIGLVLLATQTLWVPKLVTWIVKEQPSSHDSTQRISAATVNDYLNAKYSIDGQEVTLVNGKSEVPSAPGSASKIVTQNFGNAAFGDLNGDGLLDAVFLLTQTTGGSGTFYYVAVALQTQSGYEGINAVLLGDRIAPQSTKLKDGKIIVNFADRNPGEPMTATPSLGVSKYFKVVGKTLTPTTP